MSPGAWWRLLARDLWRLSYRPGVPLPVARGAQFVASRLDRRVGVELALFKRGPGR